MNLEAITGYKAAIDAYLQSFLQQKAQSAVNDLQKDAITHIQTFAQSGKTIRGSLILFAVALTGNDPQKYIAIAAGLELIHSGLLIQDDVMDNDELRRGELAVHKQYQDIYKDVRVSESMAANVADLCFFYGFELLAAQPQVLAMVNQELARVVAGQMHDVVAPVAGRTFTQEEILQLYTNKTGRYTFSLPLMMGAHVAGATEQTLQTLEQLGEHIGLVFQIRDDELNLIGDPAKTGKSVGSDLDNGKQTLLAFYLQNNNEWEEVKTNATVYLNSKTQHDINTLLAQYTTKAKELINTLQIDDAHKQTLVKLADFVKTREN
jgi:geranylgeranyl diphosphate synthase type I